MNDMDIDAEFLAMTEGLEMETPTLADLSGWPLRQLVRRHNHVKRTLFESGEALDQKTDKGSDLLIEYYSIRHELKKRGKVGGWDPDRGGGELDDPSPSS